MKTYWDYKEQERCDMSQETVTALLDIEMMEKGVLKRQAPQLIPIETVETLGNKKLFFGINGKSKYGGDEGIGICFETAEQAVAFMALKPMKVDYDYEIGTEYRYAQHIGQMAIATEQLFSFETIFAAKAALKKNKAAKDENEKLQSKYSEQLRLAEKVTENVWSDWHACRSKKSNMLRIVNTFKEYSNMTDNNDLAIKFLAKVFTPEQIDEAREWFPFDLPKGEEPAATEQPATVE